MTGSKMAGKARVQQRLQKALALRKDARSKLGDTSSNVSEVAEDQQHMADLIAMKMAEAEAYYLRGKHSFNEGDFCGAEFRFKATILRLEIMLESYVDKTTEDNVETMRKLRQRLFHEVAMCHLQNPTDLSKCVQACTTALQAAGPAAGIHITRAQAQRQLGRFHEAKMDLDDALLATPGDNTIVKAVREERRCLYADVKKKKFLDFLCKGDELLNQGLCTDALSAYEVALRLLEEFIHQEIEDDLGEAQKLRQTLFFNIAHCHVKKDVPEWPEWVQCMEACTNALEAGMDNANVLIMRAKAQRHLGNFPAARQDLDAAMLAAADDIAIASIVEEEQQELTANILARRLAEAETHKRLGNDSFNRGEYNDAILRYTATIHMLDGCTAQATNGNRQESMKLKRTLFQNIAQCHLKKELKDLNKCVEACASALEVAEPTAKLHIIRAKAWRQLGNISMAQKDLDSALLITPSDNDVLSAVEEERRHIRNALLVHEHKEKRLYARMFAKLPEPETMPEAASTEGALGATHLEQHSRSTEICGTPSSRMTTDEKVQKRIEKNARKKAAKKEAKRQSTNRAGA